MIEPSRSRVLILGVAALELLEPELARADAFPQSLALGARALHALGRDAEAAAVLQRLLRRAPFATPSP